MTMFTGEFQEKKTGEGIIRNISHEAFHDFLRYLYTDSVANLKDHVIELLAITHMYQVQGLKDICVTELLSGLDEDNAADIFQYAHLYQCDKSLKEAAFAIIKRLKKGFETYSNFDEFSFSSFAKNNYSIPDEYVDSPKEIKKLIAVRNQMAELLKVDKKPKK